MEKVLGKRHSSMPGIIFNCFLLVAFVLLLCVAIICLINNEYQREIYFYNLNLGYGNRVYPEKPYAKIAIVIIVTIVIDFFVILFSVIACKNDAQEEENVIIYNKKTKKIKILDGYEYVIVSLKDIVSLNYLNQHYHVHKPFDKNRILPMIIPYSTSYGKIEFEIIGKDKKTYSVSSNDVEYVTEVYDEIIALIESLKDKAYISCN